MESPPEGMIPIFNLYVVQENIVVSMTNNVKPKLAVITIEKVVYVVNARKDISLVISQMIVLLFQNVQLQNRLVSG